MLRHIRRLLLAFVVTLTIVTISPLAQTTQRPPAQQPPTHADILRGEYGRYRANNDLLFYHLDIRVDPEKKFISGKNTIRFRMLKDDHAADYRPVWRLHLWQRSGRPVLDLHGLRRRRREHLVAEQRPVA